MDKGRQSNLWFLPAHKNEGEPHLKYVRDVYFSRQTLLLMFISLSPNSASKLIPRASSFMICVQIFVPIHLRLSVPQVRFRPSLTLHWGGEGLRSISAPAGWLELRIQNEGAILETSLSFVSCISPALPPLIVGWGGRSAAAEPGSLPCRRLQFTVSNAAHPERPPLTQETVQDLFLQKGIPQLEASDGIRHLLQRCVMAP